MKNALIYIILIAMNLGLMYVLMHPMVQDNEMYAKVVQVGIVIVTFILFRVYLKDRGILKDKK